jgi:hypothetical protein
MAESPAVRAVSEPSGGALSLVDRAADAAHFTAGTPSPVTERQYLAAYGPALSPAELDRAVAAARQARQRRHPDVSGDGNG